MSAPFPTCHRSPSRWRTLGCSWTRVRQAQAVIGLRAGPHPKRGLAFAKAVSEEWEMTCTVKVKDGAIRLPPGVVLPDGAEVRLTIPDPVSQPSFAERYAAYIGVAEDLPPDLAANLDHYVHGHGKR